MIHGTHRFKACGIRGLAWLRYCHRCGLIALKNERTAAAMRAKCEGAE